MRTQKHLLIVFLVAALLLCCVACSTQPKEEPTDATTTQAAVTTVPTEEPTEPTEATVTTTTEEETEPTKGYDEPTEPKARPTTTTTLPTIPMMPSFDKPTTTTKQPTTTTTATTTAPTTTTTTRKLTAADCTLTLPQMPYLYDGENGARFSRITYSFADNRDGTVKLTLTFYGTKLPETSGEFDPMDPMSMGGMMGGGAFRIKYSLQNEAGQKIGGAAALFETITAGEPIQKNAVIATLQPGNYTLVLG